MDASLRSLIIWMSISLSSATYIIDDTNTTVQYSPPGKWDTITYTSFFNGTATTSSCATSDNCTMTIPFTGSGITLYMVQENAYKFSVSIDGSTPISISFPESDPIGQVNVTGYDKQSLQSGSHSLDLIPPDTVASGIFDPPQFIFDYAMINETNAFPTSNTVLPPHASGHSFVTAAAVGGTLGGIAVIVMGISIFVWILKAKRRQTRPGEFDSEHKIDTSNDYRVEKPATSPTTWQPAQAAAWSEQPYVTGTSTPQYIVQYSTTATSPALASLASTATEEDAALLLRLCNLGLSPTDITRLISIMNGRKESTVEDMKMLQRLDALNVPADDLNLVIAAMQRRGQNFPPLLPQL